jgi:hypothetical protein
MSDSPRYTYNIQLAGYAFQCKDEKGAIDFDTFVEVFENFPWGEQMRQREKMAGGCSATISVLDRQQFRVLWVSVMGNDRRPTFLIGTVIYKTKADKTRVRKSRIAKVNEIYIAPSRRSVLCAFRLFFAGDTTKLDQRISSYKLFE